MYNKITFNYNTNSIDIDLDYEIKQKLSKNNQQNNYQTSLFYEKLNNINDKYLYEAMTEATIHCKEKACGNTQCALEHRQLAEWLEELQQYRKNARKEE